MKLGHYRRALINMGLKKQNIIRKKISSIKEKIKRSGSENFAETRNRFLGKDHSCSYGTRVTEIRKIIKKFHKQNENISSLSFLTIVSELLSDNVFDCKMAGILLLGQSTANRLSVNEFNNLVYRKMDNWALSDALASEVMVKVVKESNKGMSMVNNWVYSDDEWLRRSAIVTLIKAKSSLENWERVVQRTIDSLIDDKSEYVNKALSWLQKEMRRNR